MKTRARRNFLKNLGFAVTALPLLNIREAGAGDASATRLDENDPTAQALGYRHDVADVDTGKFPRSAPVNGVQPNCANCALFQAKGGEQWGGCAIFPGKHVNAAGWCSAWAPKT